MVKLTPNVTDLVPIAQAIADTGADSLSAINTFVGMQIDVRHRRPVLQHQTGGLSGPAIRPLAVRAVWEVAGAVPIPVVGIGGIMTAADALEFLLAGAAAVQVGTADYVRPQATREIRDGIEAYLQERSWSNLSAFPLRTPVHA